jgi:sugar/nucleoside kinase (ribokinase family)
MREKEVAKIKLLYIWIFLILNFRESAAQVRYVLGGVARNVADCMSKLRTKPFMISAVGLDMAG